MRQFWFPLLMCVSILAGCSKSAPVITFSEMKYSSPPQAGILRHRFIFRNEGTAPLEIRKVSSSCGCTITEVGDTHVNPDGKSYIEATMRVLRQRRRSIIYVQTNDPLHSEITLILQANGPFPNEFEFIPNSLCITCNKDKNFTINCLLRFIAWKDNELRPSELPSPIFSQDNETFTIRILSNNIMDVNQMASANQATISKNGWVKYNYSDRTVWLWPITLEVHSTELGFNQGIISATMKAIPNESAFLFLSVDSH